jgi:hypothetical protein
VRRVLPYPPPWQDKETLAAHLSVSANTVENWSAQGILSTASQARWKGDVEVE